jgi:hypothetical protein
MPDLVGEWLTMIDFLNENGPALSFVTAVILAALTGFYVVYTLRLARSQEAATRVATEPVLVPSIQKVGSRVEVTLRNVSNAVASGVLHTGPGGIAQLVEPVSHTWLSPGEVIVWSLELPGPTSGEVVLWGGVELLYADAHEQALFRQRIFVREYANGTDADVVLSVGVARERHTRKSLVKASQAQPPSKHEDPRDGWPLSALWVAANDPQEGLVLGHA